jgi:hypothetical protein
MHPKPDKMIPALYGGIIMALISAIPVINLVNCLCCAGILLGGFLATMFYKNNFTPDTPPFTSGDCMAVGALAGVVGAIAGTILSLLIVALFGNVAREMAMDIIKNLGVAIPPEVLDKMEESMQEGATAGAMLFQFFIALLVDTLFGLLGGLIGYSVFKSKQPVMPPPSMPTTS